MKHFEEHNEQSQADNFTFIASDKPKGDIIGNELGSFDFDGVLYNDTQGSQ